MLTGPEGKPASTLRQAAPPRTLAAVAGCLELAVYGDSSAQEDCAVRYGVLPHLLRLTTLARAEVRRSSTRGSALGSEPELLPNLLLAVAAIVHECPKAQEALRAHSGVAVLLSLLEVHDPAVEAVGEVHVLALHALQCCGETQPETAARALHLTSTYKGSGAPKPGEKTAAEAAITGVHAVRALERLARPVTVAG